MKKNALFFSSIRKRCMWHKWDVVTDDGTVRFLKHVKMNRSVVNMCKCARPLLLCQLHQFNQFRRFTCIQTANNSSNKIPKNCLWQIRYVCSFLLIKIYFAVKACRCIRLHLKIPLNLHLKNVEMQMIRVTRHLCKQLKLINNII